MLVGHSGEECVVTTRIVWTELGLRSRSREVTLPECGANKVNYF